VHSLPPEVTRTLRIRGKGVRTRTAVLALGADGLLRILGIACLISLIRRRRERRRPAGAVGERPRARDGNLRHA
jgi:hypothetical protein